MKAGISASISVFAGDEDEVAGARKFSYSGRRERGA